MDYAKPSDVVASMIDAGVKKLALGPRDLLIRGALSGALLGAATALAFTGAVTTGQPLVGALIFPVSLVMIVLLGLELVTGSFALVPLARLEGKASWNAVMANWSWVFLANLLGSIAFGVLIAISLTNMGKVEVAGVAARIVAVAEAKTIGNAAIGTAGMVSVFVKGILCNWLVCLALWTSARTTNDAAKCILIFWCLFAFIGSGYEHSVANMTLLVIALMGEHPATVTWGGLLYNLLWVSIGNIVAGAGIMALGYWSMSRPMPEAVMAVSPSHAPGAAE